jgi:HEAT repeat protein
MRPLLVRCLKTLGCLMFAACTGHAKPVVALYERGDYAGAARAADSGLTAHPGDRALWQMRIRAALALGDAAGVAKSYAAYRGQLGGDDHPLLRDLAVATLGQALGSPSVKLKVAAINAVAAAELQVLADQVAERMTDDDDRVVAAAAVAVLRGYAQAPQVAGDMLHSEDPEARRIAVDGIGQKVGKLAIDDLEKAAADPDARVRRTAIRWLGQLKDAAAAGLLTRSLRDDDDACRAAAASALARIAGPGNTGPLRDAARQALGDRALAVRLAGLELLVAAHASDPAARRAALAPLIDDPDPMVATEAAIAAGGGAPAARALDRAVRSSEWTIRAGAANIAVRAVGEPAALAIARNLAADSELAVQLAAARVLVHGGQPAAAAAIFAAALRSPEHRLDAAIDLAQQDDASGIRALDAAVRDAEHGPAARAAAAGAHRSARRITPGLVAALADESGVVRVEAAAAIAVQTKRD